MIRSLLCISIVLISGFIASSSLAQFSSGLIGRGVSAKAALMVEGEGIVDPIVETNESFGGGELTIAAEVFHGNASCSSSQSTFWSISADSLVARGVMSVGSAQSEAGTLRYFFPWATIGGDFYLGSDGKFGFDVLRSAEAKISLYIENYDTGEAIHESGFMVGDEFSLSGSLMGQGSYSFQIGLEDLYTSPTIESRSETVDFSFVAVATEAVGVEQSTWGAVKSLYR